MVYTLYFCQASHFFTFKTMHPSKLATAVIELSKEDLPATCPSKSMTAWSSHPRVFLKFSHEGVASCPYCGNQYHVDPELLAGGH